MILSKESRFERGTVRRLNVMCDKPKKHRPGRCRSHVVKVFMRHVRLTED